MFRPVHVVLCASLAIVSAPIGRAQLIDPNYGALLTYGDGVFTSNAALTIGTQGQMDDPNNPGAQLWQILTEVDAAGHVTADLNTQDATSLLASDFLTLNLDFTSIPEGGGLSIAGPVLISFSPQMSDDQAVPLTPGMQWTQTSTTNGVSLTIMLEPDQVVDVFQPPPFNEISGLHLGFQVVPEPASLGCLALVVSALATRRRAA
ncbi:MAG TPA: PEP-CTERM sorting domain-containing protein [Phycisphaerae bacterium]|jgi:hypothetical protein